MVEMTKTSSSHSVLTGKARKALRTCESQLQALVGEAAASGLYDSAQQLTEWARALHALTAPEGDRPNPPIARPRSSGRVRPVRRSVSSGRRGQGGSRYPNFLRSGDELIKVGWSKKKRQEYRHRAPKGTVDSVIHALGVRGTDGAPVPTDQILATRDSNDDEIPTYQLYLILGWLRNLGMIERYGRVAYSVLDPGRLLQHSDELWNLTPNTTTA